MLNLSTTEWKHSPRPEPAALTEVAQGLRVAIVSDAVPERNGVGAYYRDLAEHLRAVGVQVTTVAPRLRAGKWRGGMRFPMPGDPTQKIIWPPVSLVARRLERLRPHAVIIPTPGPFGLIGMHLARRRGIKVIAGFHTHFERLTELFSGLRISAKAAEACLVVSNRILLSRCHLVLANTDEMVAVARSMGAANLDVMGTSIPRRFLEADPLPLRSRLSKILFAGRLAPEKNLHTVIEAARALPQLEFQIAGDGPLRGWIEDEAQRLPNLCYIGWVKRSQVMALIDDVDCLVLPSKVESFGTIALEAMARGRLVVISRHCGIARWEPLSRGLFSMRDEEDLTEALRRIDGLDPAIRDRKAQVAREAARDMNDRNLTHWLRVLNQGRSEGVA
ncbi:glycosyltransferase [Thioalkalicoccus limnaeus]|uniref:Glycosyltransferase n=1 Tax=Thioalkalicoccus limnaeus TaxID=120681 RepID=A0ABV4BF03_9GAMM